MSQPEILQLERVSLSDEQLVGLKAARLGQLCQAGAPVPPGVVLTAALTARFFRETGLKLAIEPLLGEADLSSSKTLKDCSAAIQQLIISTPIPAQIRSLIGQAYRDLGLGVGGRLNVAVRPSLVADDLAYSSFSANLEPFLNVAGLDAVLRSVQHLWAGLFTPSAINYRYLNGHGQVNVPLAVLVQVFVVAQKAGLIFTTHPDQTQSEHLVIEAVLGIGEPVVSAALTPDRYLVSKTDRAIVSREIAEQPWQLVPTGTGLESLSRHLSLPKNLKRQPKLTDDSISQLTELSCQIDAQIGLPQRLEWAIDDSGMVWFLDAQTLEESPPPSEEKQVILARGLAASAGTATGIVRVIRRPEEIANFSEGEILVTGHAGSAYDPAFDRAAAVITDSGTKTSQAAKAARARGLPCVVATGQASHRLKDGLVVTVDGHQGVVYKGALLPAHPTLTTPGLAQAGLSELVITGTKIELVADQPQLAEELSQLPVDGIGLLKADRLIAELGVHPRYLIAEQKDHLLSRKLADEVAAFARAFHPRPVIYLASNLTTDQYRTLAGGEKVEPRETHPFLGYRGAVRHLREPDLFQVELQALRTVRDSLDLRNVHLMIPHVRRVSELAGIRKLVEGTGLLSQPDFQLWMMAEVPATAFELAEFLSVGVDGVMIGADNLAQLILGVDRNNPRVANVLDDQPPAVSAALEQIIRVTREHHLSVSITTDAGSCSPELLERLIAAGITSICVKPEAAVATRKLVASIERRVMLDALTRTAHGDPHPLWS